MQFLAKSGCLVLGLLLLLLLSAAQSSATRAASRLVLEPEHRTVAQGQTEQAPDDLRPPTPYQLYLPLLRSGSDNAIWSDITESVIAADSERQIIPQKYRTVRF